MNRTDNIQVMPTTLGECDLVYCTDCVYYEIYQNLEKRGKNPIECPVRKLFNYIGKHPIREISPEVNMNPTDEIQVMPTTLDECDSIHCRDCDYCSQLSQVSNILNYPTLCPLRWRLINDSK